MRRRRLVLATRPGQNLLDTSHPHFDTRIARHYFTHLRIGAKTGLGFIVYRQGQKQEKKPFAWLRFIFFVLFLLPLLQFSPLTQPNNSHHSSCFCLLFFLRHVGSTRQEKKGNMAGTRATTGLGRTTHNTLHRHPTKEGFYSHTGEKNSR
ncbi:hypothetical protein B0J18DRAFT_132385 [Chaetomium sp. MPI-SDFR-AT-0129]|nr:hypothetical protein B0J18DRAFT_132385 [Chaetomium sp. MPI-SDFR-AT-0129]